MIVRIEAYFRKLGHRLNPDAWMARMLRLPRAGAPGSAGLVMVQIDGLGHTQFEQAVKRGRMPFLARLMRKEGYVRRRHYTGLPSNTPAVQGALFYGVKSCVPAFSFRGLETGKISHMFHPECAQAVEKRLKDMGAPLLEGGSAYGNIFTGGAKEPHFCAAAIGWGSLLKAVNPLGVPLTLLLNIHVVIRALFLGAVELVLAIVDSLRGIITGKSFFKELNFIPLRVAVCVILREICVAGARIDVVRGLPVIHVNLAGYDEQAHHRGPTSAFAHWTLRGIDKSIERIYRAARNSPQRDYDVFIYSDHGQEETIEYPKLSGGETLREAVLRVFNEKAADGLFCDEHGCGGFGGRYSTLRNAPRRLKASPAAESAADAAKVVEVTAMGAVGHIYPARQLSPDERDRIAAELVASAKIPIVLARADDGKAFAWNDSGRFTLPDDADKVINAEHPFFKDVAADLASLAHHQEAGDLVALGWKPGAMRSITFFSERGSHAGPGPEEMTGFALLPSDAMPRSTGDVIRTQDLREASFRAMHRGDDKAFWEPAAPGAGTSLRIMTYNVHGCLGRDGKVSPRRIARIISRCQPDVVCLQELSPGHEAEQAAIIGRKLAMSYHYLPLFDLKRGRCGNAIYSRFPMKLIKNGYLPRLKNPLLEPRGALWVEIQVGSKAVQILNTHLSLSANERLLQTEALLGPEWLGSGTGVCGRPAILCGDFNSLSHSKVCKRITEGLKNCQFELANHRVLKTLPSYYPIGLVDHIFLGGDLRTLKVEVPRTELEKIASDHLPLVAEIELSAAAKEEAASCKAA